ncbi:T6SS immunity protein Tli4 family protein [Rouxiella sp. Mn2063]|uniref:T6SS immunity protein Tli4 family protein n=1 Tax=Rouxiella sp. Mn2063 TaxID=3395262 RepID=UPI003BD8D609
MKYKKLALVLLALGAGLMGHGAYAASRPDSHLTPEENTQMQTFLQGMKPHCIGRYLVDMPGSFLIKEGNIMAFIDRAPIKTKRLYRPAFEQKIHLREAELSNKQPLNPQDKPFLKHVYPLPAGMEGVIFERNEGLSVPDASRVLEAYLYTNGVAVEIEMKARNGLSSRYDDDREDTPEIYGNTVPEKLAALTQLLQRMSGQSNTEIPQQAGLCLPDLFIADGSKNQNESLNIIFTSPDYAKTKFKFDTDNYTNEDSTLLERSGPLDLMIKAASGRTIQKGKRNINGQYSEEWLFTGKDKGEKSLRFSLHINEKTNTPKTPLFFMDFTQRGETGNYQLTENEAVSVWEQITHTIRLRPGAFGQ